MATTTTIVELGTTAPAFELPDVVSGRAVGRDGLTAGGRPLLLMFVCVHCPYVKHVEEELARIGRDYTGKIGIAAVSANDVAAYPADAPVEMRKQAERLSWSFPYLYDESQEAARSYGAVCTPEFFLYDPSLRLAYHSQLDDSRPRRPSGGGNDVPVTGKDLRAAIDAVLAGKAPETDRPNSIGCSIKWRE